MSSRESGGERCPKLAASRQSLWLRTERLKPSIIIAATRATVPILLCLASLAGAAAPGQPTCKAVRARGVEGCQTEKLDLHRVTWDGRAYLVSTPITARPERLYWACCARDAAGNPSDRIQQGGVLAVFLGELNEGLSTSAEECAKPIVADASEEWEMLWLDQGGGRLFVVAPEGPADIDRDTLCRTPQPRVEANAPVAGSVSLMSALVSSLKEKP